MSDTASLFSTTATLIEQPLATLAYDDLHALQPGSVPPEQCFAVLIMHHDRFQADTQLMCRVALPASYERTSLPGTSSEGLGKLDVRKRLQVHFPLTTLSNDRIVRQPIPASASELRSTREPLGRTTGRRRTMMQLLSEDIVALRTRLLTSALLTLLFNGSDVRAASLFYPAHILHNTPSWAVTKKSKAFATTPVKWATCFFTSPAQEGSVDLRDAKDERAERERVILARLRDGESDEDILARMTAPSPQREEMLDELLDYLERRGVIWGKAGHICKPSILDFDPVQRPQFIVQGAFPEPFLDRCKSYCHSGASINGKNCMKAESDERAKKAPLIIASVAQALGREGNVDRDFIAGWHVKVTLEPHMLGTAMTVGVGAVMAGGMAC